MEDTVTMKKSDADFIGKQFGLMSTEIETLREENERLREKLEPKDLQDVLGVGQDVINKIRPVIGMSDNN